MWLRQHRWLASYPNFCWLNSLRFFPFWLIKPQVLPRFGAPYTWGIVKHAPCKPQVRQFAQIAQITHPEKSDNLINLVYQRIFMKTLAFFAGIPLGCGMQAFRLCCFGMFKNTGYQRRILRKQLQKPGQTDALQHGDAAEKKRLQPTSWIAKRKRQKTRFFHKGFKWLGPGQMHPHPSRSDPCYAVLFECVRMLFLGGTYEICITF